MILISGGNGQLGTEFRRLFGDGALAFGHDQMDISNAESVESVVDQVRPSILLNCSAYTAVDAAEENPAECHAINSSGVGNLARAASKHDALLVHFSTDYVFGRSTKDDGPLNESSATSPQGVYATSKLEGEKNAALCPRHLVIRTCGLFGVTDQRRNFVEAMLRLGKEREEIGVVNDQFCNPTSTRVLAHAVKQLIDLSEEGLFHVVCSGPVSWYEFAIEIFRQAEYDTRVASITTEQFNAPAPRPAYSVLDTSRFEAATGTALPSVKDALSQYLRER